ncbi:hypothetical protein [Geodermatophilus sp. CPCC 206100]|uniref:hypothetical protein n=1 Tax=Geodermatophilus sp. CPCC 206100 TaxID=3020054 RepID=UPI003B00CA9B
MGWAIVSVVGFAFMTALVVVLARSNTARWERNHRAAQAAIRARERHARVAVLMAHRAPQPTRRLPHPHLPHPHLPHLPHVHLPAWVVDRLPHPNGHGSPRRVEGRFVRRLVRIPGRHKAAAEQPSEQREPQRQPDDSGPTTGTPS